VLDQVRVRQETILSLTGRGRLGRQSVFDRGDDGVERDGEIAEPCVVAEGGGTTWPPPWNQTRTGSAPVAALGRTIRMCSVEPSRRLTCSSPS
jgi:hypothetical protein